MRFQKSAAITAGLLSIALLLSGCSSDKLASSKEESTPVMKVNEYDVEITDIDRGSMDNKGLVIEVTDERLLEKTGGIVQGMSGSPIIQDGKLVGAVTHVLVNDPTRGYGIFIENMLEATE